MTRDALVDAVIAAAPGDLAPRLVLGDFLAERGDRWGELILLQCAGKRIDHLLADTSWFAPLHSPKLRWVFRDGLPVAFQLDGAFRHDLDHDTGNYLVTIQFRSDNKCREELWEITDQDPMRRGNGTYEVSPWPALRGHGAIVVRMTYPPPKYQGSPYVPFNGFESYGVLRGEQFFVRGKNITALMYHGRA